MAPMWSSWAWVRTTASMASRRSRMAEKSGRIRSTPGWSSSGNSTPQSTIEQPPGVLEDRHVAADLADAAEGDDRAARRRRAAAGDDSSRVRMAHGRTTPAATRSAASCLRSALGRLDERQPDRADLEAEQGEGRLHQDRALGPEDPRVRRQQSCALSCAGPDDVGGVEGGERAPWSPRPSRGCWCRSPRPRTESRAAAASPGRGPSSRRGRCGRAPTTVASKSSFASFTPTTRSCSASRTMVSVVRASPVRPGTS